MGENEINKKEIADVLWYATRSLLFSQFVTRNELPMSPSKFDQMKHEAGRLTCHLMNHVPDEVKEEIAKGVKTD